LKAVIAEKSNVEIRQFDSSDIDSIVSLLNDEYTADFTRDWWKWKYEQNPSGFNGSEGDIYVAESEGKIVAHYAILPAKFRFHSTQTWLLRYIPITCTHQNTELQLLFQENPW
jgi:hypothetical protein